MDLKAPLFPRREDEREKKQDEEEKEKKQGEKEKAKKQEEEQKELNPQEKMVGEEQEQTKEDEEKQGWLSEMISLGEDDSFQELTAEEGRVERLADQEELQREVWDEEDRMGNRLF